MKEYITFYLQTTEPLDRMRDLFHFISEKKKDMILISDLEYAVMEERECFFTEQEYADFWHPTQEESADFWDSLHALTAGEREERMKSLPWDFESVFAEIGGGGEYRIDGIIPISDRIYQLVFEPLSYPFGGTEPLKGLLKIYGALIKEDSTEWNAQGDPVAGMVPCRRNPF